MITLAKRGKGVKREACGRCGGSLKVIACIEDQDIIDRILAHLREKEQEVCVEFPSPEK